MTLVSLLRSQLNLSRLLWSIGSRMGSTVLSFLMLLAISHALPTEAYGLYIFLFSIGCSLGLIMVFGQQVLLLKHYRIAGYVHNAANKDLLLANAIWLIVGSGLLVLAALATIALNDKLTTPYDALPIAFLFGAVFTFSEYLQSYFRIHGRIALALLPRENIWRILCATLIPAFAWLGLLQDGKGAVSLVAFLLAALVGYQFYRFFQMEGVEFFRRRQTGILDDKWRTWNRETFFFSSNGFFAAASSYMETILIGILLDLEAAAFYFVAHRISMLLTLPVLVADTIGEPRIAARFQENDPVGGQKLVSVLSAGSFVCALMGGAVLYVAGPFILAQFDVSFVQHADVLTILCLGAIVYAFFGPGTSLNMIGGGERDLLIKRSIVFVAYLALLFGLGIRFGLPGIAWASVLHLIVLHVIARNWVLKNWGIDTMATSLIGVMRRMRTEPRPLEPQSTRSNDAVL